MSSTKRKKLSKQKSYVCPACKKFAYPSMVALNCHMTSGFCENINIADDRNNSSSSTSSDGGIDIQLLKKDDVYPLNKKSIQDNILQFGSCSTKSIRETIKGMKNNENNSFPDVVPRQPTSYHHPNLYNHSSIDNMYEKDIRDVAQFPSCFEDNEATTFDPDTTLDDTQSQSKNRMEVSKSDEVNLPSSTVAQIHLANILGKHKCDMSLFDEVTNWVKHHSFHNDVDWKYGHLMSRKGLVHSIERTLNTEKLKPINTDVLMHSSQTNISVPVFDFKSMLLSLLHDRHCMRRENIINNFDIFSGQPTKQSDVYGDMHTGSLYKKAFEEYVKPDSEEVGVPLYLFIDETQTDLHGSLSTAPIIFTVAWMSQECRNSPDFWRPAGFIPNLKHGSGKSNGASTANKNQDIHNCIEAILSQLRTINEEGGIRTYLNDFHGHHREVTLKPWIHLVIGDTKGNNELCGHYNNNGKVSMPYRDCTCSYDELGEANPRCDYINKKFVDDAIAHSVSIHDDNPMKSISKYNIKNAFASLPLADNESGIYRHVPPEVLHEFGNGIYKYFFNIFHDIFGLKKCNKSGKEEIELLHNKVCDVFSRQSDRSFPRRSTRNGPLDGTMMGATERRGNLFAFAVTLSTVQGKRMVVERLNHHNISYEPFIRTICLCLGYEKWIHEVHKKATVEEASKWVATLKSMIIKNFDRDKICSTGNGWNIPKFHGLSKFIYYIKLYGCGANFFGGPCECSLKKFVKRTGLNTQRRVSSFCIQVAQRNYENGILEKAYENVRDKCGDKRKRQSNEKEFENNSNDEACEDVADEVDLLVDGGDNIESYPEHDIVIDEKSFDGSFEIKFGAVSNRITGERSYITKWKKGKKNAIKATINQNMIEGIVWKASRTNHLSSFTVNGFTCYKQNMDGKQVIYRATDMYRGECWNDFCMVDYGNRGSYPSKFFGFVQYISGDIPEHSITDDNKRSMFAVIQCSTKSLSTSRIDKDFISTFRLGTNNDSFDIIPVESIMHPMLAIPSFGSSTGNLYVTGSPYEQWGKYFENEMRRIHYEEEMSHNREIHKLNKRRENKKKKRKESNQRKKM